MYTRNQRNARDSRSQRYNPPPGYTGSTFQVKHHTPEDTIDDNLPRRLYDDDNQPALPENGSGIRSESIPPDTNPLTCQGEDKNDDSIVEDYCDKPVLQERSPLNELISSLRGKIGSEELIILMVMLLISSDGMCAEVLILALCLIAG